MKFFKFILMAFLLASCSSLKEEIATEKDQVKNPVDHSEMVARMRDMLDSSKKLDQKQKDAFIDLHGEVVAKVADINGEIRKLKMVLFKHLTEQDYRIQKVRELSKQLRKLNNRKFDIMTNAMVDARKILGVQMKDIYQLVEPYHKFHTQH